MKPIFLIGYMGSGKTTLGKELARAMNLSFIDLDIFIENRFHANVRDIFASRGEEGFRRIERNMLLEVAEFENVIVACGGGTPCFFDNIDVMNQKGLTIHLVVSEERLVLRLNLPGAKKKRPLIANKSIDEITQIVHNALCERNPFYQKAQINFDSTDIENAQTTKATALRLAKIIQDMKD